MSYLNALIGFVLGTTGSGSSAATSTNSLSLTNVFVYGALAAVITAVTNLLINRSNRRVQERTAVHDDRELELQAAAADVKAAQDNAASALALAAETRMSLTGLLDNLRAQAASQHETIAGLNTTIAGLTKTISVLESSNTASNALVSEQRALVANLQRDKENAERALALAEETIAAKTELLITLEAEKLEWTQQPPLKG